MKIHVILLSCVCNVLAITVPLEKESSNNAKEYKTTLKDIRLVPINHSGKQVGINEGERYLNPIVEPTTRRQNPAKYRGDKGKVTSSVERIGNAQNVQNDPNHQIYMQKMANQLYMAQRHASLLSDYQKFIINQDPDVKNFVLAQSIQERNPKPFSRQNSGRALTVAPTVKYVSPEPQAAANADYKKIVVVTPKVPTTVDQISHQQNDNSAQATNIKYVTLAPQTLSHFVGSHEPSPKVTLVPYHTPQPYMYVGVTHAPQVETVHVPTTVSLQLGAYETPKYYKDEGRHEDNSFQDDAKYEFMYNVKDHEKHNHFGHRESRTDKTTYGFYFVHLPDGRLETVKYWADKTGYHAKVDYQGEAKHPVHTDHKMHSHNLIHH